MKTRIITIIAVLLSLTAGQAADRLQIDNITLKPGEEKEFKLSLSLDKEEYAGVQFDIQLPTGFSLGMSGNNIYYTFSEKQAADLSCQVSNTEERSYRFMVYSNSLELLKNGELMTLCLKAGESAALKEYTLLLDDVRLSDIDGDVTKLGTSTATVKVTNYHNLIYMVDGELFKAIEYEYGESITPEANPTKEGYTFSGWSEIPATMPDHDVTVTGMFTKNQYTLSISASGNGSVSYNSNTIREKTITYKIDGGSSVKLIITPDDGYKIKNVTVNDIDVTSSVSNNQCVISDIDKDTSVRVEFNAQSPSMDITQYISASSMGGSIMQTNNLINSGSQLMWKYSNNSTVSVTLISLQLIDGQTGAAGNEMVINQVVDAGSSVAYTTTIGASGIHTPVTCRFKYKYDGSEYSTDAVYKDDCTLTVKATGNGSASYNSSTIRNETQSFSVNKLSSVTISLTPDDGYQIKSVKANNTDVTSRINNNRYEIRLITGDTTIEVEFEAIPIVSTYKLTYILDGEVYKTFELEVGAMITPEAAPTKEGYTFSGWSEIPATMPDHDVTVTGTFTKNMKMGDANGDGKVDAADIADIVNYMMGKPTSTRVFNEEAADVNDDGVVNAADVVQIANIILGN